MKLAHSADEHLSRHLVYSNGKSRIFFRQLFKCYVQLLYVSLRLCFDSYRNHRFREFHPLQDYRLPFIAKGIASENILQSNYCTDVASLNRLYLVLLVGMHLEYSGNPFLATSTNIVNHVAGLNSTTIYSKV